MKRRPLSAGALRVLREICTISRTHHRPATLSDLEGIEPMVSLLNRLHTLADRWLITIDGKNIRPRAVAFRLLGTSANNFSEITAQRPPR